MHSIDGGKRFDVEVPGFARLCTDVFEQRELRLVRPALRVLPGGRNGPLRRGFGPRVHLRVVVADRR